MNIKQPVAGQQQSFTISVDTGAFSTLRPLPSIIKNALVDLLRMAYVAGQLGIEQLSLQLQQRSGRDILDWTAEDEVQRGRLV